MSHPDLLLFLQKIDTMLEDFRLKVFVTVARECSFTKAAAILNISQPAVSQHISELERTTGVKLFERLRGEVRLTESGKIFQIHAKRILAAYSSTSSLFAPLESAVMRIRVSDEVYDYVSDALALYMSIHPQVNVLRSDDPDAELTFVLKPAPKIMGGISATHNIVSSLYLCCQPSETFSRTELFESLRSFLADFFLI